MWRMDFIFCAACCMLTWNGSVDTFTNSHFVGPPEWATYIILKHSIYHKLCFPQCLSILWPTKGDVFVSLNRLLKKWQIGYVVHFAWPEGGWMLGTCCTPGPIIAHLCLEEIPLLLFFLKTDQSLKMALTMKLISGRSGVEKYTEIIPKCPIWERLTHNNINVQTFVTNLI